MFDRLYRLFIPPYFSDEDQLVTGTLVYSVLMLLTVGLVITSVPVILISPIPLQVALTYAICISVPLVLLAFLRRGYVRGVSMVLVLAIWLAATITNLLWGGINSPGINAYVILAVVGGVMLGRLAIIGVALLSVITILVLFALSQVGVLPPPLAEITPMTVAMLSISHVIIVALMMAVTMSLLTRTLSRISANRRALSHTLTNLRQTTISKDYFDNIIRSMSNLLIVLKPDHTVEMANPAALQLLGYTEDELKGLPFRRISNISETFLERALTSDPGEDTTHNNELALIARSGRLIPVSLNLSSMLTPQGEQCAVIVAQDISHIKATEAERIRNAMRYRALFEQANDAIFLMNTEGRHIAVNKRAIDLFGYTQSELLSRTFRELVVPEQINDSEDILRRLNAGERLPVYERTFIHKDGRRIPAEVSVELVYDAEGKPLHIQSIVRDISERKHAAEQLENQARLLNIISDAVISTDTDNRILTWNNAAEQVYGWRADEVIGKRLTDVIPTEFQDGSEQFMKSQYLVRGHWQSELVQYNRAGERLHILSSVSVIRSPDSSFAGVVTVNHDITARKRAEMALEAKVIQLAALRQIDVEISSTLNVDDVTQIALNAAYVLSNADAGILFINDANGLRIAESVGAYDYLTKGAPVRITYGVTSRVLQTRQPELVRDVQADPDYHPDLADTRALMAIPLLSHDSLIGVLLLETRDPANFTPEVFEYVNILTARIAAALDNARLYQLSQEQVRELQALYQRVSTLEQLKTDMIRIGSHDLRNPIGIIGGYLAMLREDIFKDLSEYHQGFIIEMEKSVEKMALITGSILSLERIEKIASDTAAEPIDLRTMVRRVIIENERAAKNKSLSLIADISDDPVIATVDPPQIHQAIFNLIENAIKYTAPGKEIRVELRKDDQGVTFAVHDQGFGIPHDQQEQLFTEGFRVRTAETESIDGTGWGLYLVKNTIERHGGEMIFESVYGKGSTFGFNLPHVPKRKKRDKAKDRLEALLGDPTDSSNSSNPA